MCRAAYDSGYPVRRGSKAPLRDIGGKRYRVWGGIGDEGLRLATVHFRPKGDGVEIECRGCRRLFISKGLRCCKPECERKVRHREDAPAKLSANEAAALASVAEVSREVFTKRPCQAPGCNGTIPRWTATGRATPKSARFCKPKCARNARKAPRDQKPDLVAITAKLSPFYKGFSKPIFGPTTMPLNVTGGHRFADTPAVDLTEDGAAPRLLDAAE
jgi:hypothetical protein